MLCEPLSLKQPSVVKRKLTENEETWILAFSLFTEAPYLSSFPFIHLLIMQQPK